MADERTRWTERIEKAGQMAFKLGEMSMISNHMSVDEAGEMIDAALRVAREQDKEIIRLQGMLGVEATDAAVDEHLMLYGTAYLYHGRLLDPTKVGIKRLKLSSTNLLKDLGAAILEVTAFNHGPIALRVRVWWDEEGRLSNHAFSRDEILEARDPYNLVLEQLRENIRESEREERPCLDFPDSKTNSTGPSAESTSSPSPEDKPANGPQ